MNKASPVLALLLPDSLFDNFPGMHLATYVGAAEGCDLLIFLQKIKIKRSQPSAAPTQRRFGEMATEWPMVWLGEPTR
ncbi:hypothetical protein AB4P97_00385 [Pseudomonas sp. A1230]|uniref:hypothetical protein n=1 Tax=Pseudomonas sp. A1230 TaxID=3235106 RepID=UPI0037836D03